MTEILHVKYRPKRFDDVVGQDAIIDSLSKLIERNASQAFLFSGGSGVGKTTLARITANEVGCDPQSVIEIDAATHTGVDEMRKLQDTMRYSPFGESDCRAVIIDEAHQLSKSAWNSLLKMIEEPPRHAYFFFCTTELGKVPQTIKTRCTAFTLRNLSDNDLSSVINRVVKREKIKLDPTVKDVIIKEANGSPRQALVNLSLCRDLKNKKLASIALKSAVESPATLELCRLLTKGGSWTKAMSIVSKLDDTNPESVRLMVVRYMSSALKTANTDKVACHFLGIIEAFSESYNPSEGNAPLFLSIGRVLFEQE